MSTEFVVRMSNKDVPVARRIGVPGGGVRIEWLNDLVQFLDDEALVTPIDNSEQGVDTIRDLRVLDEAHKLRRLKAEMKGMVDEIKELKNDREQFRKVMNDSFDTTSTLSKEIRDLNRKLKEATQTKIETENFTVTLFGEDYPDGRSGFFEHKKFGEDVGGGLWIRPVDVEYENLHIRPGDLDYERELYDYDGCYELPKEVSEALADKGIYIYLI